MAEWFRLSALNHLPLNSVSLYSTLVVIGVSNPAGLWMFGGYTHMTSPQVREIMPGESLKRPEVVFSARNSRETSLTNGQTMVFTEIILNKGDGYNKEDGVFTVPYTGIYMFTVQWCIPSNKGFNFDFVANEVPFKKSSAYRKVGVVCDNFDALTTTLITEVECIINDRPLTHSSTNPADDEPLTPSHLLYGRRITSPIYPDDREEPEADDMSRDKADKLYRFKSATIEHFWSRWKHEYLTLLREFHKRLGGEGDPIRIGDVVQIHDDTLPRSRWSLGVIDDVVIGADGRTRAARVKSRKGIITRPIAKLYPLELIE
ncbi:uncharacterized protein LOC123532288 [Mercenaria mercenaria]|uniref:uncharacterized protein LOC123532288 n=1 Tax=Mercenaria mercenaria TaxID=6596 RepID=UPI00234F46A5|nr:uncharacterized protein LOC123532288 [Mercenaria mercenaria]